MYVCDADRPPTNDPLFRTILASSSSLPFPACVWRLYMSDLDEDNTDTVTLFTRDPIERLVDSFSFARWPLGVREVVDTNRRHVYSTTIRLNLPHHYAQPASPMDPQTTTAKFKFYKYFDAFVRPTSFLMSLLGYLGRHCT